MVDSSTSLQLSITSSLYPAPTGIVIDTVQEIAPGQHVLDSDNEIVENYVFPGNGTSLETCGEIRAKAWCPNEKRYLYDLLECCDNPRCPVCWESWRTRATRRATNEIMGKFDLARNVINPRFTLSSVIWSVKPELWNASQKVLWKEFGKVIKKAGCVASAAVLHLFRFRNAEGQEIPWNTYKLNPGAYSIVREPHFHSVVIGRLQHAANFHDSTGWIYKKMKTPRGDYRLNGLDVFGIIYYSLSHVAVSLEQQRQCVHYHGLFKKARIESEIVEYENVECPDCGEPLELHWVRDRIIDDSLVKGYREPWVKKVIHRTYTFERHAREN